MTKVYAVTLFFVLVAASGSVFAKGDAAAGRKTSVTCVPCHGANGKSPNDVWPNLAGQGNSYIVKQLKAFRDGTRTDPVMTSMAKPLSDQDIENLAAFFSTQTASASDAEEPATANLPATASGAHPPINASPGIVTLRPHPKRQYWADQMPPGEGREIIVKKCQGCHDSQRTIAFARTKEQWHELTESMIERGSPVTAEELPVLVDYFTRYFGPDSPPIVGHAGVQEVGIKPCKRSEWPKGSSDFRSNWKGSYNIWLSNQQGGNVDIVDPVTKTIVRRIKCISAPDRVNFSRDGNTAYVPDRAENNVTIVDTRTGAIKAKIPLIARPNTAAMSRDFKKLYVAINPLKANVNKRGYIQVLDTATLKIVSTIETKGGIHYAWGSPDGKYLLAMSPEGNFMEVYDPQTEKLRYTCCTKSGIGSMNVEAAPDGSTSRFLISYVGFGGVVVIDAKTGKELKRVPWPAVHQDGPLKGVEHPARPFHGAEITADGKTFWAMALSIVYKLELPSLKPLGDVHLAAVDQSGAPFTPAVEGTRLTVAPDGKKVYAARPGRNLLSIIDATTLKEETLIGTGEYPLHLAIWPRGTPP